jgi:hypothetical protein
MNMTTINVIIIITLFLVTIIVIKIKEVKKPKKEYNVPTYPPYDIDTTFPTEEPLTSKYGIEEIIQSDNIVGSDIYKKYYNDTDVILDEKVLDFMVNGLSDICETNIVINGDKIDYIDWKNILNNPALVEYSKIINDVPEEDQDELSIIFELLNMLYNIYKNDANLTRDRTAKFKILSYNMATKQVELNNTLKQYLSSPTNIIKLRDLKLKLKAIVMLKTSSDMTDQQREQIILDFCNENPQSKFKM